MSTSTFAVQFLWLLNLERWTKKCPKNWQDKDEFGNVTLTWYPKSHDWDLRPGGNKGDYLPDVVKEVDKDDKPLLTASNGEQVDPNGPNKDKLAFLQERAWPPFRTLPNARLVFFLVGALAIKEKETQESKNERKNRNVSNKMFYL